MCWPVTTRLRWETGFFLLLQTSENFDPPFQILLIDHDV